MISSTITLITVLKVQNNKAVGLHRFSNLQTCFLSIFSFFVLEIRIKKIYIQKVTPRGFAQKI